MNEECEKVSACCYAPEHPESPLMCIKCNEHTNFDCAKHEQPWDVCVKAFVEVALRHANMQDALATAFAKATNQSKDDVLGQLREVTRRGAR